MNTEGIRVKRRVSKPNCYCAFCKNPRRISKYRHLSLVHFLVAFFLSLTIMYVVWGAWAGQALVILVCTLGAMEVAIQAMWRLSVRCQICGFDPVLYTRDANAASLKVKEHLEATEGNPIRTLKTMQLPKRSVKKESERKSVSGVGRSLSKRV